MRETRRSGPGSQGQSGGPGSPASGREIRKGECRMCGRCCQVFALKNTISVEQWEALRDYLECYGDVTNPVRTEDGRITFSHFIRAQCRYQLPDGRCGIHDRRPMVCRSYPTDSKNVLYCYLRSQGVDCGYYFEPADDVHGKSSA